MSDDARFPCLHASPYATRDLRWPPDAEPALEESFGDNSRMSVLDDRWAYLAYPQIATNESWMYFADLASPEPTHIDIERVAVLKDRVDCLSLCPRGARAAFVTLKWDEISLSIALVAHAQDGSILAARAIPAHAAYGRLVVEGTRAAICLSTGRPPVDIDSSCHGWPWFGRRIRQPAPSSESSLLFGDQIVIWDWQADTLEIVDLAPYGKPHQASFTFLPSGHGLALAALSPPDRGHPYPVLQVIPAHDDQVRTSQAFTPGVVKVQEIDAALAQRGTSVPADLVAHSYHTGGRIVIFSFRILAELDVEPTTDDPPGLVETQHHPDEVRTLRLRFSGSAALPVQAGNRLLVTRDPDDASSDEDEDGDEEHTSLPPPPLWILDFDPNRLRELTLLTPAERAALDDELSQRGAMVKVVTRRFYIDFEGGESNLEPDPDSDVHTDAATTAPRGRSLVYDEGPAQRDSVGSGFTRIALALPACSARIGQEYADLALTTSGVLKVPVAGAPGCMYYYRF